MSEISPVIPRSLGRGFFKAREIKVEVIAIPAEGPSLGVAPAGK